MKKPSISNYWPKKLSRSRQAFTLLEACLSLFCFSLLLHGFSTIINHEFTYFKTLQASYADDWAFFLIKLQRQSYRGELVSCHPRAFVFRLPDGRDYRYEYYQNAESQMIRLRIDRQGHQPQLMEVEDFSCQQIGPQSIHIQLSFKNGKTYQSRLFFKGGDRDETDLP